jgi:hypothetical protein
MWSGRALQGAGVVPGSHSIPGGGANHVPHGPKACLLSLRTSLKIILASELVRYQAVAGMHVAVLVTGYPRPGFDVQGQRISGSTASHFQVLHHLARSPGRMSI